MSGPSYFAIGEIVVAFVLAAIAARLAHRVIHRALGALDIVSAENRAAVHARAATLVRALTYLAYGLAAVASSTLRKPWCSNPVTASVCRTARCRPAVNLNGTP